MATSTSTTKARPKVYPKAIAKVASEASAKVDSKVEQIDTRHAHTAKDKAMKTASAKTSAKIAPKSAAKAIPAKAIAAKDDGKAREKPSANEKANAKTSAPNATSKATASKNSIKESKPKDSSAAKKSLIDKTRIEAPGMELSTQMLQKRGLGSPAPSPVLRTAAPATTGARCVQCGKELRAIPFALNNIVCRTCDGADRQRRVAALLLPDRSSDVGDVGADVATEGIADED